MAGHVRRCHYEVLEVERKATVEDIRRAYKKLSLAYHPDKNYGNQEEAAIRFKEVSNAYSILSDDQERAWYDAHRESILHGEGSSEDPDDVNLYEYFTASCFDGYDDGDGGFFSVYRQVFDLIIEGESNYDSSAKTWPSFGNSSSEWSDVQKFYSFWKNFNTVKNFAWKDEYKVNEMEDRYSRRMAERINSKARGNAKKEYVQTVQSLAQFTYRRDPRVKAELARQEEVEKARAAEHERREKERHKRRQEANKKIWKEAAEREAREEEERIARGETIDGSTLELLYEKEREMQALMRGKAGGTGSSKGFAMLEGDTDEPTECFNCPACKKQFKSVNQFKEHTNSSKHKTKLKQLAQKGVNITALMGQKADDNGEADV